MRGRWKVRLTPHTKHAEAISYLDVDGTWHMAAYSTTWEDAVQRALILADAYPWMAVGRIP